MRRPHFSTSRHAPSETAQALPEAPARAPDTAAPPARVPEPPAPSIGPRLDILSASLGETRPICDVLNAQLEAVVSETETAAVGFIERVEAIDAAVDTLGDRMGELLSQSDREATVLEEMARQNAAAIGELRRFIGEHDDTVRALVVEVCELERFGHSIRDVAHTSKVLAINALIQAAHAGESGAGFQIVAHRIQDLAGVSEKAAREFETGITDLTRRLFAELDHDGDAADAGRSAQFEQHLGAMATGQAALMTQVSDVRRAVEDADGATRTLAGLATGIAANVQFQDITRQATQQVQRALQRLGENSELLIAYVDGNVQAETVQERGNALDDMVNEYVIQRQRATHVEAATGHDATHMQDGPAIELF
ncbi:MAG: methyl-accepting chemotaxis protein [Solirubrobacteraceae bacterium]